MKTDLHFYGQDTLNAVRLLITWYWSEKEDEVAVGRSIKMARFFVERKTENLNSNDFWLFHDALGSYPNRNAELESLYQYAGENLE